MSPVALSKTAQTVLADATARTDRLIEIPPRLPPAARGSVVKSLLSHDLAEPAPGGALVATDKAFRALGLEPPAAPKTDARPAGKERSKKEQVLAMLRRPEGASGPQICAATGWLPHTTRAFLVGLAKKNVSISVLRRVPPKEAKAEGQPGGYTVYRAALQD